MSKILIQKDICPRCGKEFYCGKSGKCWCYELAIPSQIMDKISEQYETCLCPECLTEVSEQKGSN
jgi:hypothetical protein